MLKSLWAALRRRLRRLPARTPFDDGYDAFGAGLPLTANPHPWHNGGARSEWHRGWLQACDTWSMR